MAVDHRASQPASQLALACERRRSCARRRCEDGKGVGGSKIKGCSPWSGRQLSSLATVCAPASPRSGDRAEPKAHHDASTRACRREHRRRFQLNSQAGMDAAEAAGLEGKTMPPPVQDGAQRVQEENGASDRLSEKSDASLAMAEPNRPPVPAGKLKKTAFKLFGGKRSICTLPSFFGGRNKGLGKSTSKKGLSKSKTHDGISDVGYEVVGPGLLQSPLEKRTDLPSSQSALLGAEASLRAGLAWPPTSLSGSSEGFEKKAGGEKPSFPLRPKKGLRGFFNSIRRHRKTKTAEPERTELQEWTARGSTTGGQAEASGPETLQASETGAGQSLTLLLDSGEKSEGGVLIGKAGSLNGSREEVGGKRSSVGGDVTRGLVDDRGCPDVEVSPDSALCDLSTYGRLPDSLEPGDLDGSSPRAPSSDQLSLMFGDVTSLKSFDSLTGCGDIIAEPDVDSMAEGSTSADRSKEATKRGSCLVTYQGGGEEMALPEEVEEYLQQMWEGTASKEDPAYEAHLPDLLTKGQLPGANGMGTETPLYNEDTRDEADLLTPHSDQQESAPNSDEGYYDSATPGPEEDTGEGLEEVKKERLPRDSYSGDALYEFYEPDDVLMSPSHGEEPWFERPASPSEVFGRFFDFAFPSEKDFIRRMAPKRDGMETKMERLAAIQKQLLCWEMQREPASKPLEMFLQDQPLREKLPSECQNRGASVVSQNPSCLGCEEMAPKAPNSGLKAGTAAQSRDWKALQEILQSDGCLAPFLRKGSIPEVEAEGTFLESCTLSSVAQEKSGMYPFYRSRSCHGSPPGEPPGQAESGLGEAHPGSGSGPEQAVNFSQAWVEFASSGTLFSSLSESLGSSDSGSAFTQNLPALPAMVTFDVADVEQDGEGACEQHPEMNADEDLAASFEAFEGSFLPKESYAECDERMFSGCARSSIQSGSWGIASLPRRLRLHELGPPGPELLPVCRRSRSLDTECLAFELAGLPLPGNGFDPWELCSPWNGPRKGPRSLRWHAAQASAPCSPEEKGGDGSALSWPGLQNVPDGKGCSLPDEKLWNGDLSAPAFPSTWAALEQLDTDLSLRSLAPNSAKAPPGKSHTDRDGNPGLLGMKSMARPSLLPLQIPEMSQEGRASHQGGGDQEADKHTWGLPLGEKEADLPPGFDFPVPLAS
ncbi:hypothetical protein JRQ81_007509 [Phrynocephalus forsythii]|uniref:APC membrane recruitment protein 1 n=1 Tax=Phrynocephalus forsythii TaxID=171643 RepID=A0A9Q0XGN5_9SAUR|nr:hypothetical protein JRQ81_007509 [Phrynocephalus forsythii]